MTAIIVAMTKDRVIGKDGGIPWYLPEDLKLFKEATTDSIVIMGSKTYESLNRPNGLPNRSNVVITRNMDKYPHINESDSNIGCWGDLYLPVLKGLNEFGIRNYIIGGETIYKKALDSGCVNELIISFVDGDYEGDTYFPEIDWNQWELMSSVPYTGFILNKYSKK